MSVFSAEDLRFFDENGYVVLHEAVPPENLQAVVDAIFAFLGMDPSDPGDWYRPPHRPGGMVEMYQHPALWNNRQNPRIYEAFTEILGTPRLWVSVDRANLKPPYNPDHPEYDNPGFMHWDMDVSHAANARLGLQGVLYLADTTEGMGGFQCSPGHHKVVREWANAAPRGEGEKPNMEGVPVVPIYGKAGDFVIWNRMLYHGNGRNLSGKPRLAQYITMYPAPEGEKWAENREDRVMRWRERIAPEATWVTGDPRGWEHEHQKTADLTPLGRRLLGLDPWE